jgi:hypothetical protein
VAESIAAWGVETDAVVAEKAVLAVPAATTTETGTVTEELLLARLTVKPPVAAAVFSVTVQASVAEPVIDEFAQAMALSTGRPAPVRLMAALGLVEELLLTVKVPFAAPATVGLNCTVSVVDWLGFRVSGKLAPEIEKPVPEGVAELTVTAAVPVELKVRVWVVAVLTGTLPKDRLVALMFSVGIAALSCRANV